MLYVCQTWTNPIKKEAAKKKKIVCQLVVGNPSQYVIIHERNLQLERLTTTWNYGIHLEEMIRAKKHTKSENIFVFV